MPQVILNKDGRITLPASVRQNLKLKAGDKVRLTLVGIRIMVEKEKKLKVI
jgi:AbrB family looped-hinge helix DNA binding protein